MAVIMPEPADVAFILTLVEVTIPVAFNPIAVAPTPKADEIPETVENPELVAKLGVSTVTVAKPEFTAVSYTHLRAHET